jgi:hypothetical protein
MDGIDPPSLFNLIQLCFGDFLCKAPMFSIVRDKQERQDGVGRYAIESNELPDAMESTTIEFYTEILTIPMHTPIIQPTSGLPALLCLSNPAPALGGAAHTEGLGHQLPQSLVTQTLK